MIPLMEHMTIRTLATLILLAAIPGQSLAYVIISDSSEFLRQYSNPTETITFEDPLPGSLTGVSYSLGGGAEAYEVREYGWSTSVDIGSRGPVHPFWGATTWYGDHISPTIYERPNNWINRIYIRSLVPSLIYSMQTSNGFYGMLPESPGDNFFVLPPDVTISQMDIGYEEIRSVSEPETALLILFGMAFFLFLTFKSRSEKRTTTF